MMDAKTRRRIAVTGANGALGRYICAHFLATGYEVHALSRNTRDLPAGCIHHHYQLGDPIPSDLPGIRALIHCAWSMKPADARLNSRAIYELKSSMIVLDTPIIFISSLHAGSAAPSHYLRAKHEAEQLLDHGFDSIIRPGLVLLRRGLWSRLASISVRWKIIPFPMGGTPLQLTDPSHICSALEKIVKEGMSGKFNLALSKTLTLRELLSITTAIQGRTVLLIPIPRLLLALALLMLKPFRPGFGIDNLRGLRANSQRESRESLALFGIPDTEPSGLIMRYFENETTP